MPYLGAHGVPLVPAWKKAVTVDCTWLSGELLDGLICSPVSRILTYFSKAIYLPYLNEDIFKEFFINLHNALKLLLSNTLGVRVPNDRPRSRPTRL